MTEQTISAGSVLVNQAQQKREMAAALRKMATDLEQSAATMDRIAETVAGSGTLNRSWDQSQFDRLIVALNRGDLDTVDLQTLEDTVNLARLARREMRR
jgi:hypothetical protein